MMLARPTTARLRRLATGLPFLVTVGVLAVLALAYTLAGFFLVPRLIATQVPRYVEEQLQRRAQIGEVRVNPFGDLPEPLPLQALSDKLTAEDGYTGTPNDQADIERQWPQLKALYMIDRDGIVRWVDIECQKEGLAGIGKLPSEAVILQAARAMAAQ